MTELLPVLYRAASTHNIDICLVLNDRSKFAAVQVLRKRLGVTEWLSEDLRKHARTLAEHAKHGELVLFLGAGVSAGAGLPTWSALIDDIAQAAGFTTDERRQLHSMVGDLLCLVVWCVSRQLIGRAF